MAVNFVARKCACGGTLEFDPAKKIWICKYCGTIVEREATFDKIQVDGIEGISDVVRQTLKDVANFKMDSAGRNLEDCERKNHKHIGTLLASLSYCIAKISCAGTQDEARASLDKVKVYAKRLQEEFPVITAEEINLYESFGDNEADIFANLVAVFDTIGDTGRLEYAASKLKPGEVFSPPANRSLLKIAMKREKYDVVEEIVGNIGHIDRKSALQEVLEHYPDNGRKTRLVEQLFDVRTAQLLTRKYFEDYFVDSEDTIATKTFLIGRLNTAQIHCSAESVLKGLHPQMVDYESAKMVFNAIYDVKINDQETEALLVFCLMVNKSYAVQAAFFDVLLEKDVFVALTGRAVISFLDSSGFGTDEKTEILRRMLSFKIENKALDAIYNYYLNNNKDDAETRMSLLDVLLKEGVPISVNTVKNYVVKTRTDEERKLVVMEKIFATGINRTYLGDLLSEYLLYSADQGALKDKITDVLIQDGFKVDSQVLTKYIAEAQDDDAVKTARVKKLVQNGTLVAPDCLNHYILSLASPEAFSEELFNLLTEYNYAVEFPAYVRFLLFCKDIDKVRHNQKLLLALQGDLSARAVSIVHNGNRILCNLFQAYVLIASDSCETALNIVREFGAMRIKLNAEIEVNGSAVKFKKYAANQKQMLTPLSLQLCEENKVFSLF